MLKNLTVRSKLLTIVAAVVVLFGSTFFGLSILTNHHVVSSLQTEMDRTTKIVNECVNNRFGRLDASLSSLVETPEIRAVLTTDGIDHDTQLMSIIDLQHLIGADVILYCNEKGRTLARTDDPFDAESDVSEMPLIRSALQGETQRGFWEITDTPLLAIAFPISMDDEVRGVVCAGVNISGDADNIRPLLLRDVVLTRGGQVLSHSMGDRFEPIANQFSNAELTSIQGYADVRKTPTISLSNHEGDKAEHLIATVEFALTPGETMQASVLIPNQAVFGFFQQFRNVLIACGLVTVVTCVLITFRVGAIISGQVNQTLRTLETVADGDLSARLSIDSRDEFGRISQALNVAIAAADSTLDKLSDRNREMRMLLDSVEQGFFTVNAAGVISEERSGAVDRLLGTPEPGMTFPDFMRQYDSNLADWIDLGWEDVFVGIFPVEVALDQLPSRFTHDAKTFSVEYNPIYVNEELEGVAIVISDVTAIVENEQLELNQREMMSIVNRLSEDRTGFMEFINESNDIVDALQQDGLDDLTLTNRRIHTLKGNASIYELVRVSQICHEIENYIAENREAPDQKRWEAMFDAWGTVRENLSRITGDHHRGLEISDQEFESVFRTVLHRQSIDDIAVRMASWPLESTRVRLNRISEQLRGLGKRLGKGPIAVTVDHNDLCVSPSQWSDFWSSFIHLVRNAVDHGLETPEERLTLGKTPIGSIQLATDVVDDQFVVSIADDGRGIDWERITEVAYKKGLPAETQQDLVDALFADGVSTAEEVTDVSGRGVGMASVKEACEKLEGTISVESELGSGTRFFFRFPVSSMAPELLATLKKQSILNPERALRAQQDTTKEPSSASVTLDKTEVQAVSEAATPVTS